MKGERKQTLREFARRLRRMKGLDSLQLETFINNTLYILDTIYYCTRAFQKENEIPEEIKTKYFSLLHPKRDRIRFSEIQRYTRLSKRTISKHLKWLNKINLIKNLGKGYYTLTKEVCKMNYEKYKELRRQILQHIKNLIDPQYKSDLSTQ